MFVQSVENSLERLCGIVDRVLDGRSKAIGGYVSRMFVLVTVSNGYFCNVIETQRIAALSDWIEIKVCPGAIIFSPPYTVIRNREDYHFGR